MKDSYGAPLWRGPDLQTLAVVVQVKARFLCQFDRSMLSDKGLLSSVGFVRGPSRF